MRALYRKQFFAALYEPFENGAFSDALDACERLLAQDSGFLFELLRFKGEILNVLGRPAEAQAVYQEVLQQRMLPWARMGLAIALRSQQHSREAETVAQALIEDFPEFMAAYDFVAEVREEMGKLREAQEALQSAAMISPNNTARQRMVGDVAARNQDFQAAERAYGKVLERRRGSSLNNIDDYSNLARAMIDLGHVEGAKRIADELRRDWRGSKQGELAALVMDGLCANKEGDPTKAQLAIEKALVLHDGLKADGKDTLVSSKLALDLARACLATGKEAIAQEMVRKIAAENHQDRAMIAQIESIYAKAGKEETGKSLLAQVGKEIVELNNRGVLAARGGDLDGSVKLLMEAAERVPNLQFLVNASKAIFTLLEIKGWNPALAKRGLGYLRMAQEKDLRNAKVISAREMYERVSRKYGIAIVPLTATRKQADKPRA